MTEMPISGSTFTSGATTAANDQNPTFTVLMKAETIIKRVVPIVGYNGGLYTRQLTVKFINRDNETSDCGSTSDAQVKPDESFSCDKPALKI